MPSSAILNGVDHVGLLSVPVSPETENVALVPYTGFDPLGTSKYQPVGAVSVFVPKLKEPPDGALGALDAL
jgi:hypothetical protein